MKLCANCGKKIAKRREDVVCTMACGNELAHRIIAAVPEVLTLLPPKDRSKWRDYKEAFKASLTAQDKSSP